MRWVRRKKKIQCGTRTVFNVHMLLVVVLVEISRQNVALVHCDVTGGDVEEEAHMI